MRIFDRADGVRGHFGIGRPSTQYGLPFWEYWNDKTNNWESAGSVYVGEIVVGDKLRELQERFESGKV